MTQFGAAALAATPAIEAVEQIRARWRRTELTPLRGTVLDLGAGTGSSLAYLARDVQWIGLEPARAFARALEQRSFGHKNRTVLRDRAESVPLPDASVDAVICCATLCSVDDQERALREVRRVLRQGGRLVFCEHVAAPPGTWTRRAQRAVAPVSRWLDHGCHPARDTGAALARAGFTDLEVRHVAGRGPLGSVLPHLLGSATR